MGFGSYAKVGCVILHAPWRQAERGFATKDACVFSMIDCHRIKAWIVALVASALPIATLGATVEDLYEASQPVAASQDAAFAAALRTVLVRVSGRRDAPERVGAALANPRQYVQRFGITQDNVLQVGFDDASIDRLLTDAGLPIWGRERPLTLVAVALDDFGGAWLSADLPPAEKERIVAAARERGLPLQWATLDAQEQSLLGMGDGASAALLQLARRNGANAVLVGRGSRGGIMRWTLATDEGVTQSVGTVEDAIHSTADHFAKLFAAEGTRLSRVSVEVTGILDLDAYAATLNFLEGLTVVRSVAVEEVHGDAVRLALLIRGDAQTLERAIALERRLVPRETGASATRAQLAFRYQR